MVALRASIHRQGRLCYCFWFPGRRAQLASRQGWHKGEDVNPRLVRILIAAGNGSRPEIVAQASLPVIDARSATKQLPDRCKADSTQPGRSVKCHILAAGETVEAKRLSTWQAPASHAYSPLLLRNRGGLVGHFLVLVAEGRVVVQYGHDLFREQAHASLGCFKRHAAQGEDANQVRGGGLVIDDPQFFQHLGRCAG